MRTLVEVLERHRELRLSGQVRAELLSASTIDRRLAPTGRQLGRPHRQRPALTAIQRQVSICRRCLGCGHPR